ncbi:3-hydroxyacyl-CoA dehydrogenase family protein [Kitasatospora sp. NBC_01300]|uniref:3-hydroxyacyl-CoA dehydrogenase family protein n=1 Tax=Kitasatospora sp. NBC_01300 TaxID=2903574 RepID=UPI00352EF013|nr:3-hydroxyacyl-CoA dehydrogenase family protein [Kitasatospora sp. NBC_01300]
MTRKDTVHPQDTQNREADEARAARTDRIPVGIVGAGTMGTAVAQVFAAAGHPVVVVDRQRAALDAGPGRLRDGLRAARLLGRRPAPGEARAGAPGEARPSAAETVELVDWTDEFGRLAVAGFVVECASERLAVKEQVLRELDRVCAPAAVFASCTSAIPVERLASYTDRADRVLATHFMNPAYLKETVEVVRGPATTARTLEITLALLAGVGRRAHVVRDSPGFVSNRVLMPMVNDAAARVQEGVADAETVDLIFQECFGHAMGPLRTADLIGLDTIVDTLDVLLETTGDERFRPCDLLLDLVRRGHFGRKTGLGFYAYGTRP